MDQNINFYTLKKKYDRFGRIQKILKYLIIIIGVLIVIKLESYNLNIILLIILAVIIFIVATVIYVIINNLINYKKHDVFYFIILDQCDSKTFCTFYHELFEIDPNDFYLASVYMVGLRHDGQWDKIPEILKKFEQEKNTFLYKINQYQYLRNTGQDCESLYYEIKKGLEKQNKNKTNNEFNDQVGFSIGRFIDKQDYENALNALNAIDKIKNNYENVVISYLKAICYYHLNKQEESKELLEYVIDHGNTLYCVKEAEKYIEKIENEKSN